jgi:two-component system cell cycle response regulator DivK
MRGDEERIRDAGCDDYISKPVQIRALIDKVGSYFQ